MYVSNEMLKNNFKDIPVIHSIEELEKYRDQAVENEFDDIHKGLNKLRGNLDKIGEDIRLFRKVFNKVSELDSLDENDIEKILDSLDFLDANDTEKLLDFLDANDTEKLLDFLDSLYLNKSNSESDLK